MSIAESANEDLQALAEEARGFRLMYEGMSGAAPKLDQPGALDNLRQLLETQLAASATPETEPTKEMTIAGPTGDITLRVFVPETVKAVYLDIHGGGWSVGNPSMQDKTNSRFARAAGVAVASVGYRLAPENPYPAAVDDCEAAARWLFENSKSEFGVDRLIFGGGSAGAHLAVVVLLRLRDSGVDIGRVAGLNLLCGVYDCGATPSLRRAKDPSTEKMVDFFLGDRTREERRDPAVSPLYADLSGLPPALFSAAEYDDLLDDSLFMAARWKAAGNEADLVVYPESTHIFVALPTQMAEAALSRMERFVAELATS